MEGVGKGNIGERVRWEERMRGRDRSEWNGEERACLDRSRGEGGGEVSGVITEMEKKRGENNLELEGKRKK